MKFKTKNSIYEIRRREGNINVIKRETWDAEPRIKVGYSVTAKPEDVELECGMLFVKGKSFFGGLRTSTIVDEDIPKLQAFLDK